MDSVGSTRRLGRTGHDQTPRVVPTDVHVCYPSCFLGNTKRRSESSRSPDPERSMSWAPERVSRLPRDPIYKEGPSGQSVPPPRGTSSSAVSGSPSRVGGFVAGVTPTSLPGSPHQPSSRRLALGPCGWPVHWVRSSEHRESESNRPSTPLPVRIYRAPI